MSGPYCKTCKYFLRGFFSDSSEQRGECMDNTKIIYYEKTGDRMNERPEVIGDANSCKNHAPDTE